MRSRAALALVLTLLAAEHAAAIRVTPADPALGEPVLIRASAPGNATFAFEYHRGYPVTGLVGRPDGAHLHGPRLGGNLLHVAAAATPPVVRGSGPEGASAFVGEPLAKGDGWIVPITLPRGGTWTLEANAERVEVAVPAEPQLARASGASDPTRALVAIESPVVLEAPSSTVILQVAAASSSGAWTPFSGSVSIEADGRTHRADPLGPGRFQALLPVPARPIPLSLRVNVSSETFGRTTLTLDAPTARERALASAPVEAEDGVRAVFRLAGRHLVTAHDWSRRTHESFVLEVVSSSVVVTPLFASAVPLRMNATFRLQHPDGRPVATTGDVIVEREKPDGSERATFPAAPDANGTVTARIEFPSPGAWRLRLLAPTLSVNRTYSVDAGTAQPNGDTGGSRNETNAEPVEEPWWRTIPAPGVAAALLVAAWWGRRRWT